MRLLRLLLLGLILFLIATSQVAAQGAATTAGATSTALTIVLSSWPTLPEADKAKQAAVEQKIPAIVIKMESPQGLRYRVCLGRYTARDDAEGDRDELRARGYPDAWILNLNELPVADNRRVQATQPLRTPPPAAPGSATVADRNELPPAALQSLPDWLKRLSEAVAGNRPETVRPFLHPVRGLYLLYKPEKIAVAQPCVTWAQALDATPLRNATTRAAIQTDIAAYAANPPIAADLPNYDCGRDAWYADGSFVGSLKGRDKKVRRVQEYLKRQTLKEYLTPAEASAAEGAEAAMTHAIVLTKARHVRSLFVAWENNRWYLLALDLMPPCE